eukprot:TRINITY_DN21168_c0_g1_i1.p1 TRINITY_DN21168_c0_g1~~TRINITY_DN21168_c0_g1_i1.p1  ORF type:complete len:353 (+),score=95.49 TRINITY_DN21168_c0_g1_i1:43-1101(+)
MAATDQSCAKSAKKFSRLPRFDDPEYCVWAAGLKNAQTEQGDTKETAEELLPDLERGELQTTAEAAPWSRMLDAARAAGAKIASQVKSEISNLQPSSDQESEEPSLSEQTQWPRNFMLGLSNIKDGYAQARTLVLEKAKAATAGSKELQEKCQEHIGGAREVGAKRLQEAKEQATTMASAAKDRAAIAVGSAKDGLVQAGSGLYGAASLTMQPARLAQFASIFVLGMFLISASLSYLPILVIAPQKFALLFSFGSVTMLGSFAVLKEPRALAADFLQKSRLPFTASYATGLLGTLVATLVLKSYLLTALCGLMQAVALLYFCASYVPGGQALLGLCGRSCGRICSRAASAVV